MRPRPPGICALVRLHAVDASPQTTTLAPVVVHVSDTHATETPAVSVRIDRVQLGH